MKETTKDQQNNKHLLFDYERAQEMIRHYENLFWHVGAILTAGLYLGVNTLANNWEKPSLINFLPVSIQLTLLVVLFWFLWYQRNRMLVLSRFFRIWQIEQQLRTIQQLSLSIAHDNCFLEEKPKLWQLRRTRHSLLIKLFCVLFPFILIAKYAQLSICRDSLDVLTLILLFFFLAQLLFILVYPEVEPSDIWGYEQWKRAKDFDKQRPWKETESNA